MSAIHSELTAQADLTVRVSRHAPGDLESGVRAQLERVDGVRVESLAFGGLRPGLNDLVVEASAELRLRDDLDDVAAHLSSGFGVTCRSATVERPPDLPD